MNNDQDYGRFRGALLVRQFAEKLTPAQVALALTDAADTYPQISKWEIQHLLSMGDTWRPR